MRFRTFSTGSLEQKLAGSVLMIFSPSCPRLGCALYFASHQVIQSAGAFKDPDLAQDSHQTVVDKNVGHRLATREVRQPGA